MTTTRRKILNDLLVSLEPIYGLRETKSISAIVVEGILGWSRIDCAIDANIPVELTQEQQERLAQAVGELMQCRPVQYVLGESEFCALRFTVREGVLIPRPETEELIDWIVAEHYPATVLDIGTGSGAIAISLAHLLGNPKQHSTQNLAQHSTSNFQPCRVSAIDISDEALAIAAENARLNNVNIDFSKVDILLPDTEWVNNHKFDLIVSNPPYIPNSDMAQMRENVLNYEPHIALFVDDNDPLIFYRTIATHAHKLLENGGWIYFEIYENLATELTKMLESQGYTEIELRRDINDKARMIRCRKSLR